MRVLAQGTHRRRAVDPQFAAQLVWELAGAIGWRGEFWIEENVSCAKVEGKLSSGVGLDDLYDVIHVFHLRSRFREFTVPVQSPDGDIQWEGQVLAVDYLLDRWFQIISHSKPGHDFHSWFLYSQQYYSTYIISSFILL